MQKQYAITQVCEISMTRAEIEKTIVDTLLARGADPSYDFATGHPIFVWNKETGALSIRFVQGAVTAREGSQFINLKPMPSEDDINKIMWERNEKVRAAQTKAANELKEPKS